MLLGTLGTSLCFWDIQSAVAAVAGAAVAVAAVAAAVAAVSVGRKMTAFFKFIFHIFFRET